MIAYQQGLAVVAVAAFAAAVAAKPVIIGGARAEFDTPATPQASVVLLPGDAGLSAADPLQRSSQRFVDKGFAVLAIEQTTVVRAAMKYASETATPVSIAAVSSGVRRLAGAIAAPGFRARKVVFVSGNLDAVREVLGAPDALPPTLVVHHRADRCSKTSPAQVERFAQWAGPKVTVRWMEGGSERGDPCGPESHHGMAGLDEELVEVISSFLSN
jgi:hypothetical protein